MIKKLMCGLALAGSALSSQAAVQGFDWSYSGFTPSRSSEQFPWGEYGDFDPRTRFSGRFYAEDLDNNGTFSMAEVRSFTIDGQSFFGCSGYKICGLSSFSYTPGSAFAFDAYDQYEYGVWGSGWTRNTRTFRTGDRFYTNYENDWSSSGASNYSYHFTPETKFAISAVPEPQTWLMLGAGIALLGALKRRRSRAA
jgi:hypothetical protein